MPIQQLSVLLPSSVVTAYTGPICLHGNLCFFGKRKKTHELVTSRIHLAAGKTAW